MREEEGKREEQREEKGKEQRESKTETLSLHIAPTEAIT